VPALMEKFSYKSIMQVPKLTKIVVNMGLGEAIQNPKVVESAQQEMALITGQWPLIRKARKSIATFKLREGMNIGCKVTLRRQTMYQFLDKLINVAMPRVRDFRGINPHGFDGRGNFSMGVKEQIIFPEIDYDKIDQIRGMNITLITTAASDEEGRELLGQLGMPFRK
jgi:large subunit ribosomal protein L5